jgi:hypothetical protein
MNPVAGRLVAFTLVLAGSFGTAYGLGEALPGHSHGAGHTHTHAMGVPVPPGFSFGGFQLVTDGIRAQSGTFHLETTAGTRVTGFTPTHGALLHTIIIRRDLSGFQHVHPTIGPDGTWTVPLPDLGAWHLVFEMQPSSASAAIVVSANIDEEKPVPAVPLPGPNDTVTSDGLTITRTDLTFTVTGPDGQPATGLEPYLGQPAHLVAMRQSDLAYLHVHPMVMSTPMVGMFTFGSKLPQPGTYRLFLQFGHTGKVLTVPFTVVQP